MAEKRIPVQCAIYDAFKVYSGYNVNAYFAVRRIDPGFGGGWFLIHKATGYSAGGSFPTRRAAISCGLALVDTFGNRMWSFKKPPRRLFRRHLEIRAVIDKFQERARAGGRR